MVGVLYLSGGVRDWLGSEAGRFYSVEHKRVTKVTSYRNPIQFGVSLFVMLFMLVLFGAMFVGAGYWLIRAAYTLVRP